MSGPYSPRQVAKTMLELAKDHRVSLTNLTIQKLIYLAHGLSLAKSGHGLVDEEFQAWKYGPVLESLYHDLKFFGSARIPADSVFLRDWEPMPFDDRDAIDAINGVLTQCGRWSGSKLVDFTHDIKGPWYGVYKEEDKAISIPQDQIKRYFRGMVT